MVPPVRFELAIFWLRTRYPKPLDDGGNRMECLSETAPESSDRQSDVLLLSP